MTTNAEAITPQQADVILSELRNIRSILEQQQVILQRAFTPSISPEQVQISVATNWRFLGSDEAPVTIVEFTDLQCAFCRRFHAEIFPLLKKNYIDTGKLRYVSRDLPLEFHQYALKAAEAAQCAGDQGKFWELRNAILESSAPPSEQVILDLAKGISLNLPSFQICLDSERYKDTIQKDVKEAVKLEINGTPTFVLARSAKDLLDGVRIVGTQPYPALREKIDKLIELPGAK